MNEWLAVFTLGFSAGCIFTLFAFRYAEHRRARARFGETCKRLDAKFKALERRESEF